MIRLQSNALEMCKDSITKKKGKGLSKYKGDNLKLLETFADYSKEICIFRNISIKLTTSEEKDIKFLLIIHLVA